MVLLCWRHARKDLVLLLTPGVVGLVYVGNLFLIHVDVFYLRKVLGMLFFLLSIQRSYSTFLEERKEIYLRQAAKELPTQTYPSIPEKSVTQSEASGEQNQPPEAPQSSAEIVIDNDKNPSIEQLAEPPTLEPSSLERRNSVPSQTQLLDHQSSENQSFDVLQLPESLEAGNQSEQQSKPITRSRTCLSSFKLGMASLIAGSISGFLAGSFGTGGPPVMVYFSWLKNLRKEEIRGKHDYA